MGRPPTVRRVHEPPPRRARGPPLLRRVRPGAAARWLPACRSVKPGESTGSRLVPKESFPLSHTNTVAESQSLLSYNLWSLTWRSGTGGKA